MSIHVRSSIYPARKNIYKRGCRTEYPVWINIACVAIEFRHPVRKEGRQTNASVAEGHKVPVWMFFEKNNYLRRISSDCFCLNEVLDLVVNIDRQDDENNNCHLF